MKYEGLPIFMITKPVLLISPKPAFFWLSGSWLQSNTSSLCKSKAHCHLRRGKRGERRGMSPNQCQNTPLGSYLQTRVLGASSRHRMNQIRVTEDRGCESPGGGQPQPPNNSGDVEHTKKCEETPKPPSPENKNKHLLGAY